MFTSGLLFLACLSAYASSVSTDAPQVIVIEGDTLKRSAGDTVIEKNLQKLQDDYGVHITRSVLAGYILDKNDDGKNRNYEGYDVTAKLANPFFAKYFHNPVPQIAASKQATDEEWAYATKGIVPKGGAGKVYSAAAIPEIDHVYFGESKFGDTVYLNRQTKKATDAGFESMLHEALHVWHNAHFDSVTKLLHSKGSYFDRVKASNAVCKDFVSVSGDFDLKPKPACGFSTHEAAMMAVLKTEKWPQRYGALSQRKYGRLRTGETCSSSEYMEVVESKPECFGTSAANDVGDMHAFDSEFEYFAILMQLAIFSPQDFKRIATPDEAAFAKALYAKDFQAHVSNGNGSSKSLK